MSDSCGTFSGPRRILPEWVRMGSALDFDMMFSLLLIATDTMAGSIGFEPMHGLTRGRLSKPLPSATRPTTRVMLKNGSGSWA